MQIYLNQVYCLLEKQVFKIVLIEVKDYFDSILEFLLYLEFLLEYQIVKFLES